MLTKFFLLSNCQTPALLLIEGSKVGVEQITKHLEEVNITSKTILNLANRLIDIEKNNIQELNVYTKSD